MTRLVTDGAEFGDVLLWATSSGLTASTTFKRTGAYSYKINGSTAYGSLAFTAASEFYFRYAFYNPSGGVGIATNAYLLTLKANSGATTIARIKYSSTQTLNIENNSGSTLASGAIVLNYDTWYMVELYYKVNDSTGAATIRIDAVQDANYSGDTKPGSDTTVDTLYFEAAGSSRSYYIDDLGLNNTDNSNGLGDNSWCGDGRIEILSPNGNGNANQWVGSDSNSTDNYLLVDDIPASATDYVETSTNGQKDNYAMGNFDATGKSILRVWGECRAADTLAEGAKIKVGVRPGSTDQMGPERSLVTAYAIAKGADYKTNPDDSSAWEDADLDAIEFVVEAVA